MTPLTLPHRSAPIVPGHPLFGNLSEFKNDRIGLLTRISREYGDIECRIGIEAAEGIDKRLGDCGVDGIAALGSQQANDGDSINCGN